MSSDNEAKALFFAHNGEKYYMSLNGTLDEYERFAISENTEWEWLFELIDERFSALSKCEFNLNGAAVFGNIVQLLNRVKQYPLTLKAMQYLEDNINNYDSLASILLLESGLCLLEKIEGKRKSELSEKLLALSIWLKIRPYEIKEKPTGLIRDEDISLDVINKRIDRLNNALQAFLEE